VEIGRRSATSVGPAREAAEFSCLASIDLARAAEESLAAAFDREAVEVALNCLASTDPAAVASVPTDPAEVAAASPVVAIARSTPVSTDPAAAVGALLAVATDPAAVVLVQIDPAVASVHLVPVRVAAASSGVPVTIDQAAAVCGLIGRSSAVAAMADQGDPEAVATRS
jgi:hypothetical protein